MNIIEGGRLQLELLARLAQKPPWFEPDQVRFWDDAYIAQQMLKAHLDPDTDAASRKPETIEASVRWLIDRLALEPGAHLLDLGCGPGLYSARFAARGGSGHRDRPLGEFHPVRAGARPGLDVHL
ncbi:MAG: class I SAM-dependent methyltransferase [Anaerolineae bacterium]|nr:class I SAM-dependent methyltransferase [Anaerolineae bacterium]